MKRDESAYKPHRLQPVGTVADCMFNVRAKSKNPHKSEIHLAFAKRQDHLSATQAFCNDGVMCHT